MPRPQRQDSVVSTCEQASRQALAPVQRPQPSRAQPLLSDAQTRLALRLLAYLLRIAPVRTHADAGRPQPSRAQPLLSDAQTRLALRLLAYLLRAASVPGDAAAGL